MLPSARTTNTPADEGRNESRALREQGRSSRGAYSALGLKPGCTFDYKDVAMLKHFISPQGKVVPRRVTGLSARDQRSLMVAIGRARHIALLPFGPSSLR